MFWQKLKGTYWDDSVFFFLICWLNCNNRSRIHEHSVDANANAVSKNVGRLASWSAQADNPGTALTVGECPRPGGQNYRGREGAILTKCFQFTRGVDWQVPCFYLALASWIRPLLTIIIMINAELRGRHRTVSQCPGWEGEILAIQDILSWGLVDTHWSHFYVNSARSIESTECSSVCFSHGNPIKRF